MVYRFYCIALYHSQTRRHVIKIVLKQIQSYRLVSSIAISKRLQILPGYSSTYMYDHACPILKRVLSMVLINEVQSFKDVYNTNNASGPFQLINLKWKLIQKYSPVLWLHNFVEPGKTMINVVFSLTILLYTLPTLVLFLLH